MVANPLMLVAKIFVPIHSKSILQAVLVMKNAWTVVPVRAAMNAALSLPPHYLPPPALPPALPPAPQQALHPPLQQQALPQRQQAALQPPPRNRLRLRRIQTGIIHYQTSTY